MTHRILTFLPREDAVQTSLFSKQWNSIQKSFPILEFYPPGYRNYLRTHKPKLSEQYGEFIDVVERSLQYFVRNKLTVERVGFRVSKNDENSVRRVNTWLPLALHNGVSALNFFFERVITYLSREYDFYPLPETIFSVNSTLLSCSSKFFCLQKLELSKVVLSENILRDIVRNCPNLSDLSLLYFFGLKSLNLSEVDKLVSLTITVAVCLELMSISVLGALSLERFSLMSDYHSLSCRIDLISCYNLRELELRHTSLTDSSFNLLISRLPLLEVLDVLFCEVLELIRISLQRLKHLKLRFRLSVKTIEIDAPVLSKFVLTPDGFSDLPVLVLANVVPGSMYLNRHIPTYLKLKSSWFLKMREWLTTPFKGITFSFSYHGEASFNLDELREALIPPPVEVDCLDLTYLRFNPVYQWKTLLDGLLWSCHPKTIRSGMLDSVRGINSVKVLCEMLNENKCKLCCNFPCCKCWRYRLKAVKLVSMHGIEFRELNYRSIKENYFSNRKDNEVRFVFDWDHSA